MADEPVLKVSHLYTSFLTDRGELRAVDDMSYQINKGECMAMIGESGSGKSVSALSVLRLIPYPPGIIRHGEIFFEGRDLLKLSDAEIEKIRGNEISMIFQEPSTALNPVIPVGKQITESILLHGRAKEDRLSEDEKRLFGNLSESERAMRIAASLLEKVGIPNPEVRLKDYPYQFSGGMQQRAMIAMGMCCRPKLLIADEPTTALDVTVQAQVLEELNDLRKEYGTALLIITHNLGIVARYADTVKIVYGGKIVEEADVEELFEHPLHPYTNGLIRAVPRLDRPRSEGLTAIKGEPPDMSQIPPDSCAFAPRCPYATERCKNERPLPAEYAKGHFCSCFYAAGEISAREGGGLNA